MQNDSRRFHESLRQWGPAYGILFVSLFSTAVLYLEVRRHTETREHQRFEEAANAVFKSAELHLDYHIEVLKGIRALSFANERVSRDDWKKYFQTYQLGKSHPGIIDLGYVVRVASSDLSKHVAAIKQRDLPNYSVYPEGIRAEYFPIIYLEDIATGDPGPIGWDIYSNPQRRAAMERARDTGQPSSTGKVWVDISHQPSELGFVVYLPVYRGGVTPPTPEARREALQGFVFGSFRPSKLWKGVTMQGSQRLLDLEIFDGKGTDRDHLFYDDDNVFSAGLPAKYSGAISADALGREWNFYFSATPAFAADSRQSLPVILLGSGLAVSLLLFGIALKEARAKATSEKLAQVLRRSEETLQETNEQLESKVAESEQAKETLRKSEMRLRALIGSMDEMVLECDADGTLINVWTTNEELLARPREALIGHRAEEFFGTDFANPLIETFRRVLATGQPESVEHPLQTHSGLRWFLTRISAISSMEAAPKTVCLLARDISERKSAEQALVQSQSRLSLLNSVLSGMAAGNQTDELVDRAVLRTKEIFPNLRVCYSKIDNKGKLTVLRSAEPLEWPSLRGHALDLAVAPEYLAAIQRREPVIVSDVATDLRLKPLARALAALGHRAILDIPLRHSPNESGILCLKSPDRHDWSEHEIVTAQEIAEHLSLAFRHEEAERQKRQAEEQLAAEKELLTVTLRSIDEGLITTDVEAKVLLMNRVAESLTGWKREEALGRPIIEVFDLVDAVSHERLGNPVEKVLRSGEIFGRLTEALLVARDETERIVATSTAPIFDAESKIIGSVLVFRDVSERRKLEAEMLKASKIESLGLLAGGIAHDFNNILTGILGNVALAKVFVASPQDLQKRLDQAEIACLRARDLTEQLLNFAKSGSPLKKTSALNELIDQATSLALRGSNLRSDIQPPEDLWPVNVDPNQIKQAINNLVLNAADAMPEGGVFKLRAENVHLTLQSTLPLPAGRYVKMIIEDQGIGIRPEHLTKIFDPYFSTKPRSSGLGLATTYLIIKKHGGLILAHSEVGVGTKFEVYLPASSEAIEHAPSPVIAPSIPSGRILIMDDDPLVLDLAGTALSRLGYQVELAKDGAQAVQQYSAAFESKNPFAAVILDLTVPGGIGAKGAIIQLTAIDPNVRAIVSSGYSTDPVMANFREHGFIGSVTKPYRLEELAKVLHQTVRHDPPPIG